MNPFSDFRSAIEPERDDPAEYPDQMPPLRTIGAVARDALLPRLEAAAKLSRDTESPIETILGLALHDVLTAEKVEILPQFPWRQYRADWAIRRAGKPLIFVEADGAEFHSAPKDVERDSVRDATAAKAGIKTFRFTGREIYASALACALVVRNWVRST
jgi:very-short-patch-repair endonuclease